MKQRDMLDMTWEFSLQSEENLLSQNFVKSSFIEAMKSRLGGKDDAFCKLDIHGKTFFKSLTSSSKTESF